jgi:hypothetical protein
MTQSAALEDELDIPDAKIGAACRALIAENKKITIRAVAERTGVAHTTYSRDPRRKAQITKAQEIQRLAWTIKQTHRGQAAPHESVALARLRQRLDEVEAHNQLLIASHRAMLSAIGELGGTRAWLRLFATQPDALASLGAIGALPENVIPIQQADTDTTDCPDPSTTAKPEMTSDEHERVD